MKTRPLKVSYYQDLQRQLRNLTTGSMCFLPIHTYLPTHPSTHPPTIFIYLLHLTHLTIPTLPCMSDCLLVRSPRHSPHLSLIYVPGRRISAALEIEKDLRRTFPGHPLFESEDGKAILRRILLAYARLTIRTSTPFTRLSYVLSTISTLSFYPSIDLITYLPASHPALYAGMHCGTLT